MRYIYLIPFMILISVSVSANAQPDSVLVAPKPDWVKTEAMAAVPVDVTGLAFLRQNSAQVHLDEIGQSTYQLRRIKILDSRALDLGNLALTWNPAVGSPIVHKVLIHRDGAVIDILKSNKFEVLRRENQLEQSVLNGFLTAVLRVPDLRVGDELECAFTLPSNDPTLKRDSFGLMTIDPAPLPGRHDLAVSWEKGEQPAIRVSKDLNGLERRTKNSFSVSLENPEMLSTPKDAPPRYSWQRVIEYSDFTSWPAVSKKFNQLFIDASKLSPSTDVEREAKRISSAHASDLNRMKAALELVQQQVRYVYVGLDGGNFKPISADETWQRRYGDCKGKSVLLLALLRELGIDAEIVLVNNTGFDDGFDARLPSPSLFDHVLLRVNINGTKYWLDGTLPNVVEPSIRPFLPYRWVLPLTSKGSELEAVRQTPYELPQELGLVEIDARAGFDKPARRVQTLINRGVDGLAKYLQYSAVSSEQLQTAFRNAMIGSSSWDEIDDVSFRYDRGTQASILKISGTATIDWDEKGFGRYDLSLPGGGFRPPEQRKRATDSDIPFYESLDYSCDVTTVRLPKETDYKNWNFNTVYETTMFGRTFYRNMERRDDGTIRMVRASRIQEQEITSNRVEQDNIRLDDFDNSKAVIKYYPDRVISLPKNSRPVPATYEMDWSDSSVPCLPDNSK